MGFLGEESGEDEVEIKASEQEELRDETELKQEVESKFADSGSASVSSTDSSVSLEDIHRQNEKIISMLEDMSDDEQKDDDNSISGDGLDGVL
jgi:hypothetical protein